MLLRSFIVTLSGVVMAAGSVLIAKDMLGETKGSANAAISDEMVNIVVARRDIEFGQPVGAHLLDVQPWPREALPEGAFTDIAQVLPANANGDRRVLTQIFAGDIILNSKLAAPGERVTIVQKLGENTRAVAIRVDAATAVGGFVTPGDHVDIVLTESGDEGLRAGTILQNIRIVGVDQSSEENSDQPVIARTVTVEVTPDQGQRLALAQRAGTLSLTLRTLNNSVEDQPLQLVELGDLFAVEEANFDDVTGEVQPHVRTITIRRGITSEEVQLR